MEDLDVAAIASHPVLAELTTLAAAVADAPLAGIALRDESGTWHAVTMGLEASDFPAGIGETAVDTPTATLVIEDARSDVRLHDDRAAQRLGVRSCLLAPVTSPEGDPIGCVAVLDTRIREFDPTAVESIATVARQVERRVDRAVEQHHLRDLSMRLVESERALSESLARLEMSNRDLEHFAFFVAHELQSPLTAVTAFADVLEQMGDGGVDHETLTAATGHVREEARRLREKVDSLLQLSQASSGSEPRIIGLETVIRRVLATISDAPAVAVRCDPQLTVAADETALQTVIANLVGNASKYRHPDRDLRVDITARQADGTVTIDVTDNGIGIAPEDRQRIFEVFQRADSEVPGTGVGLSLCRRVVERLGGTITVVSTDGEGSTFRIALPAPS